MPPKKLVDPIEDAKIKRGDDRTVQGPIDLPFEKHALEAPPEETKAPEVIALPPAPAAPPEKRKVLRATNAKMVSLFGQMTHVHVGALIDPRSYGEAGIQRLRDAGVTFEEVEV